MDSTGVCCDNLWLRHHIPAKELIHHSIRWAFSIKHQQRATRWIVSTQTFYVALQSPGHNVTIQQGDIRWRYYLKEIIYSCTFVVPFCKWGRYFYDLQTVRVRTRTLTYHYNKDQSVVIWDTWRFVQTLNKHLNWYSVWSMVRNLYLAQPLQARKWKKW